MNTLAAGSIALPLDNEQTERLNRAVAGLSPAELQWVSGYVAGLAAGGGSAQAAGVAPASSPAEALTILYGSQTGNGEGVAKRLKAAAEDQGFAVRLSSLADYKPSSLKRETLVTFVISTHGEGDPPDDAELFHEFLLSEKAPKLAGVKYAVFALGDSSYVNFCQTGREFDERLAALGAERLLPIVECDVEFETEAATWTDAVVAELSDILTAANTGPVLRAVEAPALYDRSRPFAAEVLVNQKITGGGSGKDVRHIELSLEDSGLVYEPGDSLAVIAENPPRLVDEILEHFELDGGEIVSVDDEDVDLRSALLRDVEITAPTMSFLKAWAAVAADDELSALLEPANQADLVEFFDSHQVIDIVRRYPADVTAAEFTGMLRRMAPRSYSIASSLAANPDEVHLTVAAVRYDAFGTAHEGAASTYLADRIAEGETVPVFVEKNPRFRLPADDVPIIMVGPGTGVAPFRAFVEERHERGASGSNWLFFGDRTFSDDFLYQLEWQRYLKQGALSRLDVAFSRDQAEKIYVQDRIREQAADVYAWLERGAVVYVCGDAKHMAGDVHTALIDVLVSEGGLTADAAETRLKELKREGRYQRDVY